MSFLYLILILLLVELGLILTVSILRRSFPWIITTKDELPKLDHQALKKFINYSFDPVLGWVRKPNTSGTENGQKGTIKFNIDQIGSRACRLNDFRPNIAAFGDSYTFCRQVEDVETWEAQLAEKQGLGVLNFGVGNYGVDQSLLRYENTLLPDTVRVVVIGFVPETICRIQSYWKHYLEFGNTFAFKPRFVLESTGNLNLVENSMKSIDDFKLLQEKLPEIRNIDGFYYKKFRSLQFRLPYLLSFMRNPFKQSILITSVVFRGLCRLLGISNTWLQNLPFTMVMKNNIRDSHELYKDSKSTELLTAIMLRFKNEAINRGHIPLVLVMPQLFDLKLAENKRTTYQDYFCELNETLSVIDLTTIFLKSDIEKLYINDQYGGHLSAQGNLLVAENISTWLSNNLS